jgi:hypothetical protein
MDMGNNYLASKARTIQSTSEEGSGGKKNGGEFRRRRGKERKWGWGEEGKGEAEAEQKRGHSKCWRLGGGKRKTERGCLRG